MAVPDFQSLLLPALEVLADGAEHASRDLRGVVAEKLSLSAADLSELLPSGTQPTFHNRIHWALWYLQRCGLTQRTRRGVHRITDKGRTVLAAKPDRIDLSQFPEWRELRGRGSDEQPAIVGDPTEAPARETPEALIERAYSEHRGAVVDDLLARLRAVSPRRFEQIVVKLLVAMGYGGSFADAAQAIGKPGDEGIDGRIKEDRLGLDVVYVQAKRWGATVGRPEIQKFAGSLQGARAKKGIFITTSEFSREAEEYVERIDTKIVLIDGETLCRYLFEFGVGVRTDQTYSVKSIEGDFFDEE